MQDHIALMICGMLILSIQAFEAVANVAAFFAVAAGLCGLVGRCVETIRVKTEGNVSKDDRDIRIQDATTTGSLIGLILAGLAAAYLLIN